MIHRIEPEVELVYVLKVVEAVGLVPERGDSQIYRRLGITGPLQHNTKVTQQSFGRAFSSNY